MANEVSKLYSYSKVLLEDVDEKVGIFFDSYLEVIKQKSYTLQISVL